MDEEMNNIAALAILNHTLITLCAVYYILYQRNQNVRRYWIRPVNRTRHERGHYFTLFQEMKRSDPEQFFVYTRMNLDQFNLLVQLVHPFLKKRSRRAISTEERLAITLKYLSQGVSMQTLMWNFCLGKATISNVLRETCNAIWDALMPMYLTPPTKERFREIAAGFDARWNYPHCLGAIDGKHVQMQCPQFGGFQYFNYKKTHSLILMAACDGNCRFTFVDIGGYGSQGDMSIFRASDFGQKILENTLEVPEPAPLQDGRVIPYHFVGDEAFPLRANLLRPYPGRFLTDIKRIFNYRLSRARRTIENAFGILASRWRIFRGPIIASVETVEAVVKATVCLHNFLKAEEENIPPNQRRYCPPQYEDEEDGDGFFVPGQWRAENNSTGLQPCGRIGGNNAPINAINIRDSLANFFDSVNGQVPWQYRNLVAGALPDGYESD